MVHSNSFYDNGTTFDETNKHAAINMGSNDKNSIQFNLLVNNIKDYYQDNNINQTDLNSNLSFPVFERFSNAETFELKKRSFF